MDTTGVYTEWEYEYDKTETEDFYLVLELPPASSLKTKSKADDLFAAHDPSKKATKGKVGRPRKRTRTAVEIEEDEGMPTPAAPTSPNGAVADDVEQQPESPAPLPNIQDLNLTASEDKPTGATPDGLQIMDLDSDNPVIMYQGQMYTCNWASSIGSDLLFMKRPEDPEDAYLPLRSFQSWDLLSIGAAKLVAAPATIERKQDVMRQTELDAPIATDVSNPMVQQSEDVLRQARFLNRIADIKVKRGEQVGNLKALADSVFTNPENFGPDGRPVKRGKGGNSRARAARARAVAPSPSRQPGAVSATTPTPASWGELGGQRNT